MSRMVRIIATVIAGFCGMGVFALMLSLMSLLLAMMSNIAY